MYISYEYYRIFYHVARCGNLTKAAEALQNSQPNLTRAIRNLEFDPGGRGAVPAHKDRLYGN